MSTFITTDNLTYICSRKWQFGDKITPYGKIYRILLLKFNTGKEKEEYLYRTFLAKVLMRRGCTIQSAQAWITQFYLQITLCLSFLRERSPDVTTTATEAADIQLQLTIHLSTPKG